METRPTNLDNTKMHRCLDVLEVIAFERDLNDGDWSNQDQIAVSSVADKIGRTIQFTTLMFDRLHERYLIEVVRDKGVRWGSLTKFGKERLIETNRWPPREFPRQFAQGSTATATRTTTYVSRLSYSAQEAAEAHSMINAAAQAGTFDARSAAAYKAHITRRTVR